MDNLPQEFNLDICLNIKHYTETIENVQIQSHNTALVFLHRNILAESESLSSMSKDDFELAIGRIVENLKVSQDMLKAKR